VSYDEDVESPDLDLHPTTSGCCGLMPEEVAGKKEKVVCCIEWTMILCYGGAINS